MSIHVDEFNLLFQQLTGKSPYPWQTKLFLDFVSGPSHWPSSIQAPTGAGKTSLMPVWLIALCSQALAGNAITIPRRLVWVVNRRVVVDQATEIAENLASRVSSIPQLNQALTTLGALAEDDSRLAVSTLRGERADNGDWRQNPARASIIIGTVDMIGSRLLFRGYGDGIAKRSHHAGLLGQDSLIINDEAHLTPAFRKLIQQIPSFHRTKLRPWSCISLSATLNHDQIRYPASFEEDCQSSPEFAKRYRAAKQLHLHPVNDSKALESRILDLALAADDSRIAVFFRTPKEVLKFNEKLKSKVPESSIVCLTGVQRGYERDRLMDPPTTERPSAGSLWRFRNPEAEPVRMFLIATSAGEVGVDLSCTRLITTLDTADHLIQRFGRLNRYGESPAAQAHVVYTPLKEKKRDLDLRAALDFLESLNGNISAAALFEHPTPPPLPPDPPLAHLQPWVLDRLACTSIQRYRHLVPPLESFLHGQQENLPRTTIVWRWEVEELLSSAVDPKAIEQWFENHSLLSHEKIEAPTPDVREYLSNLADSPFGAPKTQPILVLDADGTASIERLADLIEERNEPSLRETTIVLPPDLCFLNHGMLGRPTKDATQPADVADMGVSPQRSRALPSQDTTYPDQYIAFEILITREPAFESDSSEPEELALRSLRPPRVQQRQWEQGLLEHQQAVARTAAQWANALGLTEYTGILEQSGHHHDLGKQSPIWKTAMGVKPGQDLAKTARMGRPALLNGYRHEFGSLLRSDSNHDLCRHLIAAHHGRGRPHFEPKAWDREDPTRSQSESATHLLRYANLQQQLGPYELAYLESLLRAADWKCSEEPQPDHV